MRHVANLAALALALLLLALPTWLVRGSRDLDRVDDAELQGWRRTVREADRNAWTYLQRALHESVFEEDDNEFRRWVVGRYRDAAPLREFLRRNAGALRQVERALREPRFELPERPAAQPLPELEARRLGEMLRLRALVQLEDGETDAAFADGVSALRLGRKLETAEGAQLLHGSLAIALREGALRTLRTLAARSAPSQQQARRLAAELEAERSDTAAWQAMWGHEYQSTLEQLGAQLAEAAQESPASLPFLPDRYQLHPNRTRQRVADFYRDLQRDSEGPCTTRPTSESAGSRGSALRPNAVGETLVGRTAAPHFRDLLERRCLSETALSATQALLALHAHEAEHGALPQRLDDLVPDSLAAVPRDGFGGAPLRYLPEQRVVYSVGSDLADAGGAPSPDPSHLPEPTFGIPAAR